jgi:plastocyanin
MGAIASSALLLLSVATCAGSAPVGAEPATTDHVDLPQSYVFRPTDIVVKTGTTVTWKNSDNFTHNVHLIDGDRTVGTMKPGESVSFAFVTAGTYRYECTFHPQNMRGTVTVR